MTKTLVKFCEEDFNIGLECKTLQLGTFDYYRELDPGFIISDPDEAIRRLAFKNDLSLPGDLAEQILGPNVSMAKDKKLNVGPGFTVQNVFPNCYIFCATIQDQDSYTKRDAQLYDEKYNSCYRVTNVDEFINNIKSGLLKKFNSDLFTKEKPDKFNCKLFTIWRKVTYLDQKHLEISSDSRREIEEICRDLNDSKRNIFLKDKKDEYQKEGRIAFVFLDDKDKPIPVKKDPLIIDLDFSNPCWENISLLD